MLPPDVVRNLDDWLLAEYQGRNKVLDGQLRQKQAELIARGLGQSGAMISMAANLAAQELTIRANITFQRFLGAADDSGVPIDDDFRTFGRGELDRRIRFILVPELRSKAMAILSGNLMHRAIDQAFMEIDLAADRATRKYQAELASLVVRRKTQRQQSSPLATNVFNVSGAVGVIQIGSGNSATSFQQIDNSTVSGLREALEHLAPQIVALPDSAINTPKQELLDLILESQTQLQKPQPNWTLLRSLLAGVATSIQTIASLRPSYETLKGLLTLIGINLP